MADTASVGATRSCDASWLNGLARDGVEDSSPLINFIHSGLCEVEALTMAAMLWKLKVVEVSIRINTETGCHMEQVSTHI